ncbi:MAG: EAL domain-containing protein [Sphaerobacteraceae bacterium]|nr:MAG: EAL domain-containing protein [Sphaerobacteraceae bacterium]
MEILLIDQNTLDEDALASHIRPHFGVDVSIRAVSTNACLEQLIADAPVLDLVVMATPPPGREVSDLLVELFPVFPATPMVLITGTGSSAMPISQIDSGRVSFLPIHQLARLPFMLGQWQYRDEMQLRTHENLPNTPGVDIDIYQTISNLTADYVYFAEVNDDRQIVMTYRSEFLPEHTGFTSEELQEGGAEILVHPDDRHIIPGRRGALVNGESRVDEFRLVTRDQRVIWVRDFVKPIRPDEHGVPQMIVGAAQDITYEKLLQSRLMIQASILEMIARGEDFDSVLKSLNDLVEEQISDALGCIMLVDREANTLYPAAHSRLPDEVVEATRIMPIGPEHGACGSAAYYKALTITTDVNVDPKFDLYRDLMNRHGVLAVWSTPIFRPDGSVAGTIALYFRQRRTPIDHEIALMESAAQIAAIAFDVNEREIQRQLAEVQYQTLVEQLPAMTLMSHPSDPCDLTYLSPQFGYFSKLPAESFLGDPDKVRSFIHPEDREGFDAAIQRSIDTSVPLEIEFRIRRLNGTTAWVQASLSLVHGQNGEPLHWLGIMVDVTDRNEALRQKAESDQRYRSLFDENINSIVIYNYEGIVVNVNPAGVRIAGYSEDELMGDALLWLIVPEDRERAERYFLQARAGVSSSFQMTIVTRNGERVELSSNMSPVVVDGEIVGVSSISEDVTERRRLESQLLYQAYHDPLTGLPNRVYFDHMLSNEVQTLGRDVELAILFLDLNNFKVINDSLGHDIGDKYLAAIARALREVISTESIVARFGGDEFTVLIPPGKGAVDEAVELAREVIVCLRTPVVIDGYELATNVSIGISSMTFDTACEPRELIRRADIALYDAKKGGGESNLRTFNDQMDDWVLERLWVEGDLRQALSNGEFVVHYQPLIDVETGEVAVVEALLRWNHPERGLLRPDRFLRIAEETGHILEIDHWVMETACAEVAEWNRQHQELEPLEVGVNLSSRRFWNAGLREDVMAVLERTGLDPSLLCIEITESTMIQDIAHAVEVVTSLRNHGVMFAIDDFGTGYSSLSYLREVPIDVLKIDRTFITALGEDDPTLKLAEAIVAMARALNLYVIAEGVETLESLKFVQSLKCDLAQGFYLSDARPFHELHPLLDGSLLAVEPHLLPHPFNS